MKCARVAKRIQVRPSNGNCTRQTYGSKFIYSTARDRRSLAPASDANIERGVGLFAIASHSVSIIAVRSKHNQLESLYLYYITSRLEKLISPATFGLTLFTTRVRSSQKYLSRS